MTGNEAVVVKHGQALRAVTGGAVDLPSAAVTDIAGGVGDLPAVNEHSRVLTLPHRRAVGQGQVISWITITATFRGRGERKEGSKGGRKKRKRGRTKKETNEQKHFCYCR